MINVGKHGTLCLTIQIWLSRHFDKGRSRVRCAGMVYAQFAGRYVSLVKVMLFPQQQTGWPKNSSILDLSESYPNARLI
jgi:hypothetical protein